MSKRQDKKDHILWAGLELMKSQGYNGTSVKDIVDAASVPKGSFYNYFESKESFAIDALEAVFCQDYDTSRALLFGGDKTALERLSIYFEKNVDRCCDGEFKVGCFFGNMCQEMADSNETIRVKVRQVLGRNTQLIVDVLEEAKAAGEIGQSVETNILAEFILNAWEGTLMRMKASKTREPLDIFLSMLPQLVH